MSRLDPRPARNRETAIIMLPLSAVCVLGFASSIIPAVEATMTRAIVALVLLVAVAVALRLGVRWVRERIEDRADARTAAVVRSAAHRPAVSTQKAVA